MRRFSKRQISSSPSSSDVLVSRAHRHRDRGEHRRAMLVLREACHRDADSARLWTLYAVACVRNGRRDEAVNALKQAVYLRERARDVARVRVTRALLQNVTDGASSFRALA
jgi:Flp pilus assembly protein TadD